MIRNADATVYYTVWSLATGELVAGDSGNHTIYYTADDTWEEVVQPITDLGHGVYSFTLPAEYTDVPNAIIRVESSNESVIIPPVDLTFDTPEVTVAAIEEQLFTHDIGDGVTFESAVATVYSEIDTLAPSIDTMSGKMDGFPAGSDIARKSDIPTLDQIKRSLLITSVANYAAEDIDEYSVGAMILGSFCSVMDPTTGAWTIKLPNGTPVAVRSLTTSDEMKPVVGVR